MNKTNKAENEIKAVLFDLDGTILDTEKYFRKCWPAAFEHFGYSMTDQQALSLRSLGRPFAPGILKEMSGDPDFDYEAVRSYRSKLMEETIEKNGLQLKAGCLEILDFLKERGIVRAVATASPQDRSERYLKKAGILEYFDRVISATMVKEGKPSPDIYLYACEQLGFAPEDCIAVEDSPNGVLSASRAGCKTVFIPDQTPPTAEELRMCFAVRESLDQIKELFE